jgi:hypothetical protein
MKYSIRNSNNYQTPYILTRSSKRFQPFFAINYRFLQGFFSLEMDEAVSSRGDPRVHHLTQSCDFTSLLKIFFPGLKILGGFFRGCGGKVPSPGLGQTP